MSEYTDTSYGDRMAAIYDCWIRIPLERAPQAHDFALTAQLAGARRGSPLQRYRGRMDEQHRGDQRARAEDVEASGPIAGPG
jgi:hypothetical protein